VKIRSKIFGSAAIYFGANVLNAAIPFLLLPVLTRVLTPADYGRVAMFAMVLTILGAFTGLSVHGAIAVRYFQMEKEEMADYVGTCVGILLISTSVIGALVAGFGAWLSEVSGIPARWLLVAVVLSGVQFIGNIRLSLWQVAGQARRYGSFQVTQSLLNALGSLFFILVVGMAWEGRVLGQALAVALLSAVAVAQLLGDNLVRFPRRWREHSRDALAFGMPLIPHVIGGLLIVAADRLVIVRLLDIAHAGVYMVALQVGQALGLITEAFNKAYTPWFMESLAKPSAALREKIVLGTYLYFFLVILIAAAFGFMAPVVVDVLVGESFRNAGGLVIYIALGFAFGGCYYMVANYLFFESKTVFLAVVTFATGLINIPLMYVLVKRNGIVGAGQAFLLTQLLCFVGTWLVAQRVHPMPWLAGLKAKAS
jgi:O-antigen/teichoic acid export membrane protein